MILNFLFIFSKNSRFQTLYLIILYSLNFAISSCPFNLTLAINFFINWLNQLMQEIFDWISILNHQRKFRTTKLNNFFSGTRILIGLFDLNIMKSMPMKIAFIIQTRSFGYHIIVFFNRIFQIHRNGAIEKIKIFRQDSHIIWFLVGKILSGLFHFIVNYICNTLLFHDWFNIQHFVAEGVIDSYIQIRLILKKSI